tara:strand:- start:733 stop:924 length:192 start_codon:yes stop_codon:yes gene_type:complete
LKKKNRIKKEFLFVSFCILYLIYLGGVAGGYFPTIGGIVIGVLGVIGIFLKDIIKFFKKKPSD